MSDIVERLREYASDDHERLCEGRCYSCSCGYDDKRDPLLVQAAARIEQLEAALRECEATVVTHHAEDVARTDWSGSGMAQKKARAVATRSGLLMHNIMIIIRAALGEERT